MQPQETPGGGETSLEAPRDTRKPSKSGPRAKNTYFITFFVDIYELGRPQGSLEDGPGGPRNALREAQTGPRRRWEPVGCSKKPREARGRGLQSKKLVFFYDFGPPKAPMSHIDPVPRD